MTTEVYSGSFIISYLTTLYSKLAYFFDSKRHNLLIGDILQILNNMACADNG